VTRDTPRITTGTRWAYSSRIEPFSAVADLEIRKREVHFFLPDGMGVGLDRILIGTCQYAVYSSLSTDFAIA